MKKPAKPRRKTAKAPAKPAKPSAKGHGKPKAAAASRLAPRKMSPAKSSGDNKPKAGPSAASRPIAPTTPAHAPAQQTKTFERAIVQFHGRKYKEAKELFDQAAQGPSREMAHAARLHIRMCEQRLAAAAPPQPRTVEDFYNLAVALINQRELEGAESRLHQALALMENGDHLHYALALCRGLKGDAEGACQHLKRAIDLQPRNRAAARNDPDFAEISNLPALRDLLYPERKSAV